MRVLHIATLSAALSLAACASTPPVAYVSMSYTSTPSGALVVRDGVTIGRTPMTLMVKAPLQRAGSSGAAAPGCLDDSPVTFKWASGATTTVADPCRTTTVHAADLRQMRGSDNLYTAAVRINVSRPNDAPGLMRDVRTGRALGSSLGFFSPALGHVDSWRRARSEAERYNTLNPTLPPRVPY